MSAIVQNGNVYGETPSGDLLVGEQVFYANFSNKMVYSTYRASVNIPHISRYNVELVKVNISGNASLEWAADDNAILIIASNTLVISSNNTKAQGSPCAITVNITPKN